MPPRETIWPYQINLHKQSRSHVQYIQHLLCLDWTTSSKHWMLQWLQVNSSTMREHFLSPTYQCQAWGWTCCKYCFPSLWHDLTGNPSKLASFGTHAKPTVPSQKYFLHAHFYKTFILQLSLTHCWACMLILAHYKIKTVFFVLCMSRLLKKQINSC